YAGGVEVTDQGRELLGERGGDPLLDRLEHLLLPHVGGEFVFGQATERVPHLPPVVAFGEERRGSDEHSGKHAADSDQEHVSQTSILMIFWIQAKPATAMRAEPTTMAHPVSEPNRSSM